MKIDFRVSAAERDAWTRAAESQGITVSDFVRNAANGAAAFILGVQV